MPKRFAHLRDKGWCALIRSLPCAVGLRCEGRIECAHVRTRGAGGADRGNTLALCLKHHSEQHAIGIKSFECKYGLDLRAIARELEARYTHDHMEAA